MRLRALVPLMALMLTRLVNGKDCGRVVCYYTNGAQHRPAPMNFLPQNINVTYCTHLMFAFAAVDDNHLTHLEWDDDKGQNSMYRQFNRLKKRKPGLKTLLAVNGHAFGTNSFRAMIRNGTSRQVFIMHSTQYLRERNFNGLDLHWEDAGSEDNGKFRELVRELRQAYNQEARDTGEESLLITAAMHDARINTSTGSNMAAVSNDLDFISIMSQDLDGPWDTVAGYREPLYLHNRTTGKTADLGMRTATEYWVRQGVAKEKLNIGVSFSGRSFKLGSAENSGPAATVDGDGRAGNYTRETGALAYYEICQLRSQGNGAFMVSEGMPYFQYGDLWVGYDNPSSLRHKVGKIQRQGFGGVTIWSLDMDDFNGQFCNSGPSPLLSAVGDQCRKRVMKAPSRKTSASNKREAQSCRRFVCYYSNQAQFRPMKLVPEGIDAGLCSHFIFASATMKDGVLAPMEKSDDPEMYRQFNDLKKTRPRLKTMLSVGGLSLGIKKFTEMVKSKEDRQKFIDHSIKFLRDRNFDGLDMDFEYPGSKGSPVEDKERFTLLVKELREAYEKESQSAQKPRLLISAAVSPNTEEIRAGYEVPEITKYLDFITVMTYDLHGSWEKTTGHHSPLYGSNTEDKISVDHAMRFWKEEGADKDKLLVGLATYARSFELASADDYKMGDAITGGGKPGEYTNRNGFLSYYEVCQSITEGAKVYFVDSQQVPFMVQGNQWVGYDSQRSLKIKVKYALDHSYGGVAVSTLDYDDFSGEFCSKGNFPLIKAIKEECNFQALSTGAQKSGQASASRIDGSTFFKMGSEIFKLLMPTLLVCLPYIQN